LGSDEAAAMHEVVVGTLDVAVTTLEVATTTLEVAAEILVLRCLRHGHHGDA
jgi:hypothetical protein